MSNIERRAFLIANVLVAALACGCAGQSPTYSQGPDATAEAGLPGNAPVLYYVSAPDCVWCTQWTQSYYPAFERSAARQRLRFVVLRVASERLGPLADSAWPNELRWIRDVVKQRPGRWLLPFFVLVEGDRVVASGGGTKYWQDTIVPAISEAVGIG